MRSLALILDASAQEAMLTELKGLKQNAMHVTDEIEKLSTIMAEDPVINRELRDRRLTSASASPISSARSRRAKTSRPRSAKVR